MQVTIPGPIEDQIGQPVAIEVCFFKGLEMISPDQRVEGGMVDLPETNFGRYGIISRCDPVDKLYDIVCSCQFFDLRYGTATLPQKDRGQKNTKDHFMEFR